ncbi:MAG: hypothetical protein ACRDV9_01790 [Acidimicrobiia bacterium]
MGETTGITGALLRSGLFVGPLATGAGIVLRGGRGGASAAVGVAVAAANLAVSAYSLEWAARVSTTVVAAVALGGYVVRLVVVSALLLGLRAAMPSFDLVAAGVALIVAHLALTVWQARRWSSTNPSFSLIPAPASDREEESRARP